MKYPLLAKLVALGAITAALLVALSAVDGVVSERQQRQQEAQRGMADSLAGAQTLLGPALQRRCRETWQQTDGEGKDSKTSTQFRDRVQTLWPAKLDVATSTAIEPRYRGLFKVNGYLAKAVLTADWADTAPPEAGAEHPGSRMQCEPATLAVALGDARGIRSVNVIAGGQSLAVLPGSLLPALPRGLHAVLPDASVASVGGSPLRAVVTLELAGTASMAWAPVGDESSVHATSDWPHPSFGGQFLPVSRQVTPQGFEARWQVSGLATTAQQALRDGATLCELRDSADALYRAPDDAKRACVETFGVHFMNPVNGYVLSDRALKYGLLFIVLTFVAVALVEVMRKLRVHPVQYLLVGCALTVFFLLLVSLGEHLSFDMAYLCASVACTALLTFYGRHVLQGTLPGLVFGAGIALLYGALYALLQLEQTALMLGSILLFVVLAAVMVATRRIDWYAQAVQLQGEPGAPA
ncbi:MAG: creD [Rhizobacter sp.]|nr:creD [Rhizobacter sp.]